jgi:hypothetical protein
LDVHNVKPDFTDFSDVCISFDVTSLVVWTVISQALECKDFCDPEERWTVDDRKGARQEQLTWRLTGAYHSTVIF